MKRRWSRREIAALMLFVAVALTAALSRRAAPDAMPVPSESEEPATAIAPLTGLTIAIDPGHGGYDQGCSGRSGVLEAPLNLAMAFFLREELQALGARVVLTREEDVSLVDPKAPGNRKQQDMALREALIRDSGAEILLSIHMNAYAGSSAASGALAYYTQGDEEGRQLAAALQGAFHGWNARHNQEPKTGDYFILSTCEVAALVECGFLSNPTEEALLATPAYQREQARVIAQGVLAYWQPGQ